MYILYIANKSFHSLTDVLMGKCCPLPVEIKSDFDPTKIKLLAILLVALHSYQYAVVSLQVDQ